MTEDGNGATQVGVMNPLTGQAGVQSHVPPTAQDQQQQPAAAASSSDAVEQEPQQEQSPARTRGLFTWWTQSDDSVDKSTDEIAEQSAVPSKRKPQKEGEAAQSAAEHDATSGEGQQEEEKKGGVLAWVKGFLPRRRDSESGEQKPMEATPVVVDEVIVPKDLPLDAIAAEVQVSIVASRH